MPGPAQWGAGARRERERARGAAGLSGRTGRAGQRQGGSAVLPGHGLELPLAVPLGRVATPPLKGLGRVVRAAVGRAGFGPALFKAPGCAPGQQQREPLSRRDPAPPPGEGESPEPQHSASQSCKGAAHALLKFSHRQINMNIK